MRTQAWDTPDTSLEPGSFAVPASVIRLFPSERLTAASFDSDDPLARAEGGKLFLDRSHR